MLRKKVQEHIFPQFPLPISSDYRNRRKLLGQYVLTQAAAAAAEQAHTVAILSALSYHYGVPIIVMGAA